MPRTIRLAVLVSGEGTTLDALAERVQGGHVPARIVLVLADRPHAGAIEKARARGLPTRVLPFRGTSLEAWSRAATDALCDSDTELVLLAGFLAILPGTFLNAWAGRVVNVHPSLLPKHGGPGMYGERVHASVLASGDRTTGATLHVVTEGVDAGPVLDSASVPVEPGDTPKVLRARVRPLEIRLISELVRDLAEGRRALPLAQPEADRRARA
ncbi:MAG: phosphoribosylglycinamide formyltransferase [Thermoplasmata archaeon]